MNNLFLTMLKSRVCFTKPSFTTKIKSLCTPKCVDDEKEKELARIAKDASIDEPPTTCCQSGCSNCVYIAWAEALTKKMETATPEIAEKILNMVQDPNMKAYIEMELRLRGFKQ